MSNMGGCQLQAIQGKDSVRSQRPRESLGICRQTPDALEGMNQVEANMSNTCESSQVEWKMLDWRKAEKAVFKLQKRIYQASANGNLLAVRKLQKTLMRSWSARLLAVRKVTQDNQGKVTAGVDGIKNLKPQQRLELAKSLKLTGKSSPTLRVYIPKPGKNEKRPLGIPTMFDRALQALAKLALEPEWESKFHEHSYGFRPGRSAQDAIEAIFNSIRKGHKHILDADISQCFDKIDHAKLLEKLNTYPSMRRQIKSWLRSGVINDGIFENTESGTPQGGVISPLLANIALHGIERLGNREKERNLGKDGRWRTRKVSPPTIVRYADDFVVIHERADMIPRFQKEIEEWLKDIGLELKPSKTKTTDTAQGFNFLGFNIRQYKVGAYRAAKKSSGTRKEQPINLGFKTLIKPSKEAISRHLKRIEETIDQHRSATQADLIKKLNPIIKGWCNYYEAQVSKEVFAYCDHHTYLKLESWARRRCPGTKAHNRKAKYWHNIEDKNWVFSTKEGIKLISHADIKITRHIKVQGARSPYDGDSIYWGFRLSTSPVLTGRVQKLLKIQKGKCPHCGTMFKHGDKMEVDHIKPTSLGGNNTYSNLQLLHRHCHDVKTARDGSGKHQKLTKCL